MLQMLLYHISDHFPIPSVRLFQLFQLPKWYNNAPDYLEQSSAFCGSRLPLAVFTGPAFSGRLSSPPDYAKIRSEKHRTASLSGEK